MKNSLFGSHYFLNACPLYVYALIFALGLSLLFIGRKIFEGKAYNVARSGDLGDTGLAGFIILAAWIIQNGNFHPALWMESGIFHSIVIVVSIISAIIYFVTALPYQKMDCWHALLIVPIFLYFIITTIPVYVYASPAQKIAGFMMLMVWLFTLVYDKKEDRLDQRKWIKKYRPEWKFKN